MPVSRTQFHGERARLNAVVCGWAIAPMDTTPAVDEIFLRALVVSVASSSPAARLLGPRLIHDTLVPVSNEPSFNGESL